MRGDGKCKKVEWEKMEICNPITSYNLSLTTWSNFFMQRRMGERRLRRNKLALDIYCSASNPFLLPPLHFFPRHMHCICLVFLFFTHPFNIEVYMDRAHILSLFQFSSFQSIKEENINQKVWTIFFPLAVDGWEINQG